MEFRQALANLAKMPMDESTRFQSAYAMAQTMGVTKQKLLESAQFYLQILGAEQAKFNEAHAQQRQKLIGGREDEIKTHESAIQQKTEQIQKLTQEIEQHRQQSEKVRADIQDSTIKIETTRSDFEASFAAVAGSLQQDAQKIQQYLS
jgi:chromosome segregation ATPase